MVEEANQYSEEAKGKVAMSKLPIAVSEWNERAKVKPIYDGLVYVCHERWGQGRMARYYVEYDVFISHACGLDSVPLEVTHWIYLPAPQSKTCTIR